MAIEHRTLTVDGSDLGGLAEEMERFAVGADGRRWMNIVPEVDGDDVPTGSALGRLVSGRGSVVPVATWLPEYHHRGAHQPTQLGLDHAAGKDAVPRLASRGVVAPSDWVLVQDHQRRGVIFAVPPGAALSGIATYAMRALVVLSPFDVDSRFRVTFSTS